MSEIQKAQEQRVARYTVALGPTLPRKARAVKFASGVLVSWKTRTFIVTAHHFVKLYPPSEIMVLFPTESANFIDAPASRSSSARLRSGKNPFRPRFGKVLEDSANDIAALELMDPIPEGGEGYDIEKCIGRKLQVREGDRVVLSGYPTALAKLFERPEQNKADVGRIPVQLDTVALYEDKPERWQDGFKEGSHIALLFDPQQMGSIGLSSPDGFSGGGVWLFERETGNAADLWVPFPQLLGVQVSWLEQSKRAKVTLINGILALLRSAQ